MFRVMTAAAVAAGLLLAGCGDGDDEEPTVAQPEPVASADASPSAAATVPSNDTERLCRAALADLDVVKRKLANAGDDVAKGDPAGYADLSADLEKAAKEAEGRVGQYPDADEDVASEVTELAGLYTEAAGLVDVDTADEFVAAMAKVRAAQGRVEGACR